MIPVFLEGLAQSLLPCSWVILVPAVLVGLTTRRSVILGVFAGSVVLLIWSLVAGWVVPPLWLAAFALALAGVIWWRGGLGVTASGLVGAGAAWAWQPCVGEELGKALNLAQTSPMAAFPGLAGFTIGVVMVGFLIGLTIGLVMRRASLSVPRWIGPGAVGALGLLLVSGLYGDVASVLARWSTVIWG